MIGMILYHPARNVEKRNSVKTRYLNLPVVLNLREAGKIDFRIGG